jgi:hypothetical protein
MEEMVGAWANMQHSMWDSWLQSVNSFGGQTNQDTEAWKDEYHKNLEVWEKSVHQALDAQAAWVRNWADNIAEEEDTPQVVLQWMERVQEMMQGWTEAQSQLWNAWFDSAKYLDPSQVAGRWDSEGQQVLQAWREATERAQETLAEWSREALEDMEYKEYKQR